VAGVINASALPAPILTTASRPLGQVKGGYTLRLPAAVLLYGIASESGLQSLGALVEQGGDDQALFGVFATLNKKYQLVLVDWRSQFVLVATASDGKVNVWRP
jgi:hypothetical protein